MAQIKIELPAMGEGITEASITRFLKNVGDSVEIDDAIVEVATDKVDSEIVATHDGKIEKFLFDEGDTAQVGDAIVILSVEGEAETEEQAIEERTDTTVTTHNDNSNIKQTAETNKDDNILFVSKTPQGKALSPLVRNIANDKGISLDELDKIQGSGISNRITKEDLLQYINIKSQVVDNKIVKNKSISESISQTYEPKAAVRSQNFEIVEMDRMRKLIAKHMLESKKTSAHVSSFVEVDVTGIVQWRNKIKAEFQAKYNEKITFTPIFMEAIVQAITEFPMINVSVEDDNILVKKDINIGMATALPSGNLIVPVIKNAASLSLFGMTQQVNNLSNLARNNKLQPSDIQGGTFTVTNMGTFGNITGTPIINQPEVAIIAIGAIKKKPAVIETPQGDTIGIRQMMILSMSYDHRVVDGALGGMFLKRVADLLEAFDTNRNI